MRLSVSNIAWDAPEDDQIADVLRSKGIEFVDLAPGKYFPDPKAAEPCDIALVRGAWEERGFQIWGLQALLFGSVGLNLFTDQDDAMFDRLCAVCDIAAGLGARTLTFGSPRQRDCSGLEKKAVDRIATSFFNRLGDKAERAGVTVCLEPNPAVYGCNYLTRTVEAAEAVVRINHPAVRLQLDVGAMALNGEDPTTVIENFALLIGHVHASEPQLITLGDGGAPHAETGAALSRLRPDLVVTVEMSASRSESHLDAVRRSVELAQSAYGPQ